MNRHRLVRHLAAFLAVLALAAVPRQAQAAATVHIINVDPAGFGFNDPTPVVPVGGNPGVTLGTQRLFALQHAANIWGATLDSNVDIWVVAYFQALPAGVLAAAGAWDLFSDFAGTPPFPGSQFAQTWYGSPLADKRAGRDLDTTAPDIEAFFSSNVNFYLGVDNNHGAQTDFVATALHELGHGLGFQNFVTETTGSNFGDPENLTRYPFQTDIYSRYTLDALTGKRWSEMTDAERRDSAIRYGGVVWAGGNVHDAVPEVLSYGSPFLRFDSPASIAGLYQFGTAAFGPPVGSPTVTAAVVLANDGAGASTSDGCEPLVGFPAGSIALIDRGTCGFVVKAKTAQNAGAVAVIIANNAAGAPPGMAGVDPTVVIPTVSVTIGDGNTIKGALAEGPVASLGVDLAIRAGADAEGRARLYAVNPVAPGSSISHFDSIASRNLLMEPAINGDLTHNVQAPEDLTLELMRDIGWFADQDTDGVSDHHDLCRDSATGGNVTIGTCDTGVPNQTQFYGCSLQDPINFCADNARSRREFTKCVGAVATALKFAGVITTAQAKAINACVK